MPAAGGGTWALGLTQAAGSSDSPWQEGGPWPLPTLGGGSAVTSPAP